MEIMREDLPRFIKVKKEHSCVPVKDKNGVLLAFRIQVPTELMNTLNRVNADLLGLFSKLLRRICQFLTHPYSLMQQQRLLQNRMKIGNQNAYFHVHH